MKLLSLEKWEFKLGAFVAVYYIIFSFLWQSNGTLANHLRVLPIEFINSKFETEINYDKVAYVQYATNYEYFNLAIMNYIKLQENDTKVNNLVILINSQLIHQDDEKFNLLIALARRWNIKLKPTKLINSHVTSTWSSSLTKLQIFNQVEFDRIVYFDSDSMFVNNGTMDELFSLPREIKYAMPQAYWLNNKVEKKKNYKSYGGKIPSKEEYKEIIDKSISTPYSWNNLPSLVNENHKYDNYDDFFATHIMMIEPSRKVYQNILTYVENPWYWHITARGKVRKSTDYDMEIINKFFNNMLKSNNGKVGILPHKVYGVLTGEFKEKYHSRFTVEPQYLPFVNKYSLVQWNVSEFLPSIKLVHFSDSPIPKPWETQDNYDYYNELKIYCNVNLDADEYNRQFPSQHKPRLTSDCEAVDAWNAFMKEFNKNMQGNWVI